MPFHLRIRDDQKTHSITDAPDSYRPTAQELIKEFKSGSHPYEGLAISHNQGALRLRWADVCDMWIEEA
jgi:hypothetical protein